MTKKTPKNSFRIKIQFTKLEAARFRTAAKNLAKKFDCRQNEAILRAIILADNKDVLAILSDDEMRIKIANIEQFTKEILQELIG